MVELSELVGSEGFVIKGIEANDRSGFLVNNAVDINGDGLSNLIIGAFLADQRGNTNVRASAN